MQFARQATVSNSDSISDVLLIPGIKVLYEQSARKPGDPFGSFFRRPGAVSELLKAYRDSKDLFPCSIIIDLFRSRRPLIPEIVCEDPSLIDQIARLIADPSEEEIERCKSGNALQLLEAVVDVRDNDDRYPFFRNVWKSNFLKILVGLLDGGPGEKLRGWQILPVIARDLSLGTIDGHFHLYEMFRVTFPWQKAKMPECWKTRAELSGEEIERWNTPERWNPGEDFKRIRGVFEGLPDPWPRDLDFSNLRFDCARIPNRVRLCLTFASEWVTQLSSDPDITSDGAQDAIGERTRRGYDAVLNFLRSYVHGLHARFVPLAFPEFRFGELDAAFPEFMGLVTKLGYLPTIVDWLIHLLKKSPFLGSPVDVLALKYLTCFAKDILQDSAGSTWSIGRPLIGLDLLNTVVYPRLFPPPAFIGGIASRLAHEDSGPRGALPGPLIGALRQVAPNSLTLQAATGLIEAVIKYEGEREKVASRMRVWVALGCKLRRRGGFYGSVGYRGVLLKIARAANSGEEPQGFAAFLKSAGTGGSPDWGLEIDCPESETRELEERWEEWSEMAQDALADHGWTRDGAAE
jgi:hypothetical protein